MIFVKFGGSLITDKNQAETARLDVVSRLAKELAEARQQNPDLEILLGHGSGSFGHPVADRFDTLGGASTPNEWSGFGQVWHVANKLNRIVVDALRVAGIPSLAFPPSASTISSDGEIESMSVEPIQRSIRAGLLPVIQGDVAFDRQRGSTILSTEKVFRFLAPHLEPNLVLLAGVEKGVYGQYPPDGEILASITEEDVANLQLGPSTTTDVTGGMLDKVREALAISKAIPGLRVRIFSGEEPGSLLDALRGSPLGTLISSS